jgi:hypothetical protein
MNEIDKLIKKYHLTKNEDGTFDCRFGIIAGMDLVKNGQFIIQFNKVGGDFICERLELTSLKGSPKYIGNSLHCNNNNLTTLKYGPLVVNADYYCSCNNLISLKGSPHIVPRTFNCAFNNLMSLKHLPNCIIVVADNNPIKYINCLPNNFKHIILESSYLNINSLKYIFLTSLNQRNNNV